MAPPNRLGAFVVVDGKPVPRDGDIPNGWDLANALADGWTPDLVAEARTDPAFFEPYPNAAERDGTLNTEKQTEDRQFRAGQDGVRRLVERENKTTGETISEWVWICSSLEVIAETRDIDGENWGRLLAITDRDDARHEWALPMEMLAGSGEEYRRRLLSQGLTMAPGRFARDALHQLLSTTRPPSKARCVTRVGWHGEAFVLPDETLGDTRGERVLLQTVGVLDHAFRVRGSLEDWQKHVARLAAGNSRLLFALSTAFAAPLLQLTGAESGGVHYRGASSIGKTTALLIAGSVWGGGTLKGYVRQWRATDNGLEAVAQAHSDALLCLDELSQIDAKAAGQAAYMLANEVGKSRAGRGGEGRRPAEWRVLFLSSGEIGLADKLAEDGRVRKIAAGQQVRVIDIPADAGVGLGLFENIHGFETADAFARHLKQATAENYGVVARAFITQLTADLADIQGAIAGFKAEFVGTQCPSEADGQVSRVADRFGLVAAAGELATTLGIAPWERGDAFDASARCFQAWLDGRGGVEPAEVTAGIAQVRKFIEQHGEGRFALWGFDSDEGRTTINRAGFRKSDGNGAVEYYVLPEVWRSEVCAGFDAGALAHTLMERGLLIPGSDDKPQSTHRLPGTKGARCYRLAASILEEGSDA